MSNIDYILYHGNCYDGFGAAVVAWLVLSKSDRHVVPMPVFYGKPPPQLQPGGAVYILDFSYPAKTLLDMAHEQTKIVVLDHHATAQKDLSMDAFMECLCIGKDDLRADPNVNTNGFMFIQNIQLKFDMAKSGAMLAWEYFFPGEPAPKLIEYLQDRDLWKFNLANSKAVSAWLQTFPMDFGIWINIMQDLQNERHLSRCADMGQACLRLKEQMVNNMADHAREMLFDLSTCPVSIECDWKLEPREDQYLVPVANATVFFSEVGEELLNRHISAPFAAYYMDRADGKRQWGLRSRPDFDCSVIAKAFGGGGHKQASGFIQHIPWCPAEKCRCGGGGCA